HDALPISSPIGLEFYNRFEVPWIDTLDSDQYACGGIAWALGEIPTLLVTVALMFQWSRDEERQERRRVRHAGRGDSDDADMDAYNAYLAELHRRARGITTQETPGNTVQGKSGTGRCSSMMRPGTPTRVPGLFLDGPSASPTRSTLVPEETG